MNKQTDQKQISGNTRKIESRRNSLLDRTTIDISNTGLQYEKISARNLSVLRELSRQLTNIKRIMSLNINLKLNFSKS